MWEYNYGPNTSEDQLVHYGVIGMKWGKRRVRKAEAALSRAKTEQARDKTIGDNARKKVAASGNSKKIDRTNKLYDSINSGHAANIAGRTKRVNDAKATLEAKKTKSENKKQFKRDVSDAKKSGVEGRSVVDKKTGEVSIKYSINGRDVGKAYANEVAKSAVMQQTLTSAAVGAALLTGISVVNEMYR